MLINSHENKLGQIGELISPSTQQNRYPVAIITTCSLICQQLFWGVLPKNILQRVNSAAVTLLSVSLMFCPFEIMKLDLRSEK